MSTNTFNYLVKFHGTRIITAVSPEEAKAIFECDGAIIDSISLDTGFSAAQEAP